MNKTTMLGVGVVGVGLAAYHYMKLKGGIAGELQSQAERINIYIPSGLGLLRKPLYGFTDQGKPAGIWAYTLTLEDSDPIMQHTDNPEAILCIRPVGAQWEFAVASMSGLILGVYLDMVRVMTIQPLTTVVRV
jgi:hypothetical protein